jgi:hypothetical protein
MKKNTSDTAMRKEDLPDDEDAEAAAKDAANDEDEDMRTGQFCAHASLMVSCVHVCAGDMLCLCGLPCVIHHV